MRLLLLVLAVVILTFPAYAQSAKDYLQKGHSLTRTGDYAEAIDAFEKALSLDDEWVAAKLSLKKARRFLSYKNTLHNYFPSCSTQPNCVGKSFLYGGRPIHPLIIKSLLGHISDGNTLITGINLSDAQKSNQFCCEDSYKWDVNDNGRSVVTIDYITDFSSNQMTKEDCWNGCWLTYEFVGSTSDGIQVVIVWERTGGTGIFTYLMLLRTEEEAIYENGRKNVLVLKNKGVIEIGDRVAANVTILGNDIILNNSAIKLPPL